MSLAFGAVVLLGVAATVLVSLLLANPGFRQRFVVNELTVSDGLVSELADYYQTHGGWNGIESMLAGAQGTLPRGPGDRLMLSLADAQGQIISPGWDPRVGKPLSQAERADALPIQTPGGETVGYLRLERVPEPRPVPPQQFLLGWLSRSLLVVAAVTGLFGILFGVLASRNLTAPLSRLAEAAQAIGARDLSRRVEIGGSDEVREVAQAFNEMAAALEGAETLRRNLLADVAHELRTPLSVLQGNLRAILDDVYALDKAEVARLYDETRLLSRLVNDLHELAQAEAGHLALNRQPTQFAELVQSTATAFGAAADAKGVALNWHIPTDLPPVLADPARLTQVLHNLLDNALRHTPAGGNIALRAGCDDGEVWLDVQDSGEGIAPQDLPRVFDRFYRADPARSRATGGSGLGLAIVRAIVEAHGGQVSVASQGVPGQGSTFTLRLPVETRA
jgi:two-component system OmpR family sensor kinase/two-component system sensor histidine kinase BaeS